MALFSNILLRLTIEIGIIEKGGIGFSEMMQSCGIMWSSLKFKKFHECSRYACMPEYLDELQIR